MDLNGEVSLGDACGRVQGTYAVEDEDGQCECAEDDEHGDISRAYNPGPKQKRLFLSYINTHAQLNEGANNVQTTAALPSTLTTPMTLYVASHAFPPPNAPEMATKNNTFASKA